MPLALEVDIIFPPQQHPRCSSLIIPTCVYVLPDSAPRCEHMYQTAPSSGLLPTALLKHAAGPLVTHWISRCLFVVVLCRVVSRLTQSTHLSSNLPPKCIGSGTANPLHFATLTCAPRTNSKQSFCFGPCGFLYILGTALSPTFSISPEGPGPGPLGALQDCGLDLWESSTGTTMNLECHGPDNFVPEDGHAGPCHMRTGGNRGKGVGIVGVGRSRSIPSMSSGHADRRRVGHTSTSCAWPSRARCLFWKQLVMGHARPHRPPVRTLPACLLAHFVRSIITIGTLYASTIEGGRHAETAIPWAV